MSWVGVVQQESLQPTLLVAPADSPDGGRIALQAGGQRVDRFARGDGENDTGMLDLEPSQVPGTGHGLEDRDVRGSDREGARFPATHGRTSDPEAGSTFSIPLSRIPCIICG